MGRESDDAIGSTFGYPERPDRSSVAEIELLLKSKSVLNLLSLNFVF